MYGLSGLKIQITMTVTRKPLLKLLSHIGKSFTMKVEDFWQLVIYDENVDHTRSHILHSIIMELCQNVHLDNLHMDHLDQNLGHLEKL